jgi:hypothetical protein
MSDFFRTLRITSAEFFFIFVLSGFVIHEIYVEWSAAQDILYFVPGRISEFLGISGEPSYLLRGIILFIVLPGLLFLIPSVLAGVFGKMSLFESAKRLSILILPVMAAAHVMKSFFKIISRIPYYEFLGNDPLGMKTANFISSGQIQLNKDFIRFISPILSSIALFVFTGALVFSSVLLWKDHSSWPHSRGVKLSLHIGLVSYGLIFIVMLVLWKF